MAGGSNSNSRSNGNSRKGIKSRTDRNKGKGKGKDNKGKGNKANKGKDNSSESNREGKVLVHKNLEEYNSFTSNLVDSVMDDIMHSSFNTTFDLPTQARSLDASTHSCEASPSSIAPRSHDKISHAQQRCIPSSKSPRSRRNKVMAMPPAMPDLLEDSATTQPKTRSRSKSRRRQKNTRSLSRKKRNKSKNRRKQDTADAYVDDLPQSRRMALINSPRSLSPRPNHHKRSDEARRRKEQMERLQLSPPRTTQYVTSRRWREVAKKHHHQQAHSSAQPFEEDVAPVQRRGAIVNQLSQYDVAAPRRDHDIEDWIR